MEGDTTSGILGEADGTFHDECGRFKVVWQEGHPERKKPDRSRWTVHEKASERVDELAKQAMREVQLGGRVRPYPGAQRWRLLYQEGEEVTGDIVEAIKTVAGSAETARRVRCDHDRTAGWWTGGVPGPQTGCLRLWKHNPEGPGGEDTSRLCGDEQGAATKGASGCSGMSNVRATSRRKPLACPHQVQARADGGNEKRVGGGGHKARAVRGDKAE